ncbi:hypothetical protein ASPWEDRAFT_172730 [Aspergillus wentii DTO 134E9]|uniref:NmrA-like domain-containing protein n=1 Tax=Aspergillus wentii DTO 134E9 TaxID=1073089 RepID=A0A1L9RLX5_ASPWE|nr:uncharacterized protein ASPWEDRAFT_172730 [Aspergillus wentii DTO 134E9]OJJ35945.1 hypothetical protein ASPWEDRAFT_172730 [Aspergillus wentii DTO 134E9]
MVRIAVAGVTEVIDALVGFQKHETVVFTRSPRLAQSVDHMKPGGTFTYVEYHEKASLVKSLEAVHTVLCFISSFDLQTRLTDACIEAGVKLFAPNEWAAGLFTFREKDRVHQYLQEVNREKMVFEYCLFQPGNFLNYLSYPILSTTYSLILTNQWDIKNHRAIVSADGDYQIILSTVQDMAKVVAEAIEYQGTLLEIGGITGSLISNFELIKLAETIREIETVSRENLEAGKLGTSWILILPKHPNMQVNMDWGSFSEYFLAEIVFGGLKGAQDFLQKFWKEQP